MEVGLDVATAFLLPTERGGGGYVLCHSPLLLLPHWHILSFNADHELGVSCQHLSPGRHQFSCYPIVEDEVNREHALMERRVEGT